MLGRNSDKEWQKYGDNDPYYGVVSLDKFHKDKLTPEALDEFFESGRKHIDYVLETVRKHQTSVNGDLTRKLNAPTTRSSWGD